MSTSGLMGPALSTATATLSPTCQVHPINGHTTTTTTINPPDFWGPVTLIGNGNWSFQDGGTSSSPP